MPIIPRSDLIWINTMNSITWHLQYFHACCFHLPSHCARYLPGYFVYNGGTTCVVPAFHTSTATTVPNMKHECNTLKFVLLKLGLKCFIYEFLCTWNIGKRIFFIILKFIIRSSNMVVHTCWCIWFIWLSGLNQDSKWFELLLEINLKMALK